METALFLQCLKKVSGRQIMGGDADRRGTALPEMEVKRIKAPDKIVDNKS